MAYRTRPRFEARIDRRRTPRDSSTSKHNPPSAAKPEGRWEPQPVLAALSDMLNAPPDTTWPEQERQGGG